MIASFRRFEDESSEEAEEEDAKAQDGKKHVKDVCRHQCEGAAARNGGTMRDAVRPVTGSGSSKQVDSRATAECERSKLNACVFVDMTMYDFENPGRAWNGADRSDDWLQCGAPARHTCGGDAGADVASGPPHARVQSAPPTRPLGKREADLDLHVRYMRQLVEDARQDWRESVERAKQELGLRQRELETLAREENETKALLTQLFAKVVNKERQCQQTAYFYGNHDTEATRLLRLDSEQLRSQASRLRAALVDPLEEDKRRCFSCVSVLSKTPSIHSEASSPRSPT